MHKLIQDLENSIAARFKYSCNTSIPSLSEKLPTNKHIDEVLIAFTYHGMMKHNLKNDCCIMHRQTQLVSEVTLDANCIKSPNDGSVDPPGLTGVSLGRQPAGGQCTAGH